MTVPNCDKIGRVEIGLASSLLPVEPVNDITVCHLPDAKIAGCACAGNSGNVFPATAG